METCFKILQLKFDQKLTNRCIGLTLHISASTVFEVLARFKASSLSWPLPADISHDTLEKLIYPPKDTSASELVMPDMLYFDTEMRKPGVTRQLLWMEYKAQAGDKAMGYSHFCRCYTPEMKTAMVLKAKDVIRRGCLEYDVSATDITSSFMAIRKTMTSSGRSATYEASRSEEASHADLAWATMHALLNEPLTAGISTPLTSTILEFY